MEIFENFEIGKDYYCISLIYAVNKFKVNQKPFILRKVDDNPTKGMYYGWDFLGKNAPNKNSTFVNKLGYCLSNRQYKYLHNYNAYNIWVFDNEEEAIEAYDNKILEIASTLDTHNRAKVYKQLIVKRNVEISDFEKDAIEWYNSLEENQKKFCAYLKYKYSNINPLKNYDY